MILAEEFPRKWARSILMMMTLGWVTLGWVTLCPLVSVCRADEQAADSLATAADKSERKDGEADQAAVPPGINDEFLSSELDPEAWRRRFEVESREVFAGRESVVRALELQPGQSIADVGSGTGLYVAPFSRAVGGSGNVFAVDISPRLIEYLRRRVTAEGLSNVRVVQSTETSTMLPESSVDVIFVCDTYHHFEHYQEMLASIKAALKPGGQLVLVDFHRIPGKSRPWLLTHVRAGKDTVREEVVAAGLDFVDEVSIPEFEENYMLRFRRPDVSPSSPVEAAPSAAETERVR